MKNLLNISRGWVVALLSLFALANSLYATDRYFSGATSMSASNGGAWTNGAPAAGDSWLFDYDKFSAAFKAGTGATLTIWSDQNGVRTINELKFDQNISKFNGDGKNFYIAIQRGGADTIATRMLKDNPLIFTVGSIDKKCNAIVNFRVKRTGEFNYANMVVTGNVIADGNNTEDSDWSAIRFGGWGQDWTGGANDAGLNKLTIMGELYAGKNERVAFNVGAWSKTDYRDASRYDVADVIIEGGMRFTDGWNGTNIYLSFADSAITPTTGDYKQTVFHVNGMNGIATVKNQHPIDDFNTLSILVFTNDQYTNATFNGTIQNLVQANYTSYASRTKVVMNGEGTQRLNSGMYFTGGVDVIKGTLIINQIQNHNSMGELLVKGGTFSVSSDGKGSGYAVFDNVSYEGGIMKFGFKGESADHIELSGFFSNDSGAQVVMDFDLTNIVTNKDYRIIYWLNGDHLTENDFYAITDISGTGIDDIKFSVEDDGLYVQFVGVIPEPSAVAAILGAAALAFAAYRRRK